MGEIRGPVPNDVPPTKPRELFKKYDQGKIDYSIFPNSVLEDIIKVMMFGAGKYGMDNWKLCEDPTRYYNAGRRHEEAERSGEVLDPESGLPHTAHALCNWVFYHWIKEKQRKENDTKTS